MASNEQHRQVEAARELEAAARTLAHSTRTVPSPADSYDLLGELGATIDHLEQVCTQLGRWHSKALDGVHYEGEDERGDGATGTLSSASDLARAARYLTSAAQQVHAAHSANGVVRWRDTAEATGPYGICQRYAAGTIDRDQLIDELTRWPYVQRGKTDGFDGLLVDPPGTWAEVTDALHHGLIDTETYDQVLNHFDSAQAAPEGN